MSFSTQIKTHSWPNQWQLLTSASRTTDTNTSYITNDGGYRGVRVYIETTDGSASPSTVFSIQAKDTKNNQYHTLVSSAAVVATGRAFLEVYPGGDAVANVKNPYHIGLGFRVHAAHGNGNAHEYNIVAEWLN